MWPKKLLACSKSVQYPDTRFISEISALQRISVLGINKRFPTNTNKKRKERKKTLIAVKVGKEKPCSW